MSDSPAGKGDKNRLKGDSLKAYDKSKLWASYGKDKKIQNALSDLCKNSKKEAQK